MVLVDGMLDLRSERRIYKSAMQHIDSFMNSDCQRLVFISTSDEEEKARKSEC
ncbi:hypothetical protein QG37_01392 [Candidozyma auris]|nr:hypothetical protein QG37_01392 [[Candida] auris]